MIEVNSERWLDATNIGNEKWRGVDALPQNYQVSNRGRVRKKTKEGRYLILYAVDNGRQYYAISVGHKKHYIHRLVALAFIENPDNHPEIDHINGEKWDNRPKNLRWVTRKMNMQNPVTIKKRQAAYLSYQIPVQRINGYGEVVGEWPSIKDAALSLGINKKTLARVSKEGGRIGLFSYRRAI